MQWFQVGSAPPTMQWFPVGSAPPTAMPSLCRMKVKYSYLKATAPSNIHLPMESKNRRTVREVRSLRLMSAVKTPYLPDGRIDLEAYDGLMEAQIEGGVEGVVVGGTTGEGQLMSWEEHIMLIAHTVNSFGGSVKVIGNAGSNSTGEAIRATEQGFAVGMHAALHINPYYGRTSAEGLLAHFGAVLPVGPTILYNVPSRTGQDIPPAVVRALAAEHENLAGIKECAGNERVREYSSGGVAAWTGNDDQSYDARWRCGAVGVVSVVSNLVPGMMRELMFGGGDQTALVAELTPLIDWCFEDPNPIGVNTALAQLGVVRPVFRLPYVPRPLEKRAEFVKLVEEMGREMFVGHRDALVLEDTDFIAVGRY